MFLSLIPEYSSCRIGFRLWKPLESAYWSGSSFEHKKPAAEKEKDTTVNAVICDEVAFCKIQNKHSNDYEWDHKAVFEGISFCVKENFETAKRDFRGKD